MKSVDVFKWQLIGLGRKLLFTAVFLTVLLPKLVSAQAVPIPPSVRKAPHASGALKAPKIRLKDNSALSVEQLVPQEKIVARFTKRATLKSIQLMRYGQYQAERGFGNPEISSHRQVYKVVLGLPHGFTSPRAGTFDKATVTYLIDAETGETIYKRVVAPPGAFHPKRTDGINVYHPNNR